MSDDDSKRTPNPAGLQFGASLFYLEDLECPDDLQALDELECPIEPPDEQDDVSVTDPPIAPAAASFAAPIGTAAMVSPRLARKFTFTPVFDAKTQKWLHKPAVGDGHLYIRKNDQDERPLVIVRTQHFGAEDGFELHIADGYLRADEKIGRRSGYVAYARNLILLTPKTS